MMIKRFLTSLAVVGIIPLLFQTQAKAQSSEIGQAISEWGGISATGTGFLSTTAGVYEIEPGIVGGPFALYFPHIDPNDPDSYYENQGGAAGVMADGSSIAEYHGKARARVINTSDSVIATDINVVFSYAAYIVVPYLTSASAYSTGVSSAAGIRVEGFEGASVYGTIFPIPNNDPYRVYLLCPDDDPDNNYYVNSNLNAQANDDYIASIAPGQSQPYTGTVGGQVGQ
jgi:hypothetical protein